MAEEATTSRRRGLRRSRNGTVLSRSGDKTIVVLVETRKRHPLYGKVIKEHRKVHVHDAANTASIGDRVEITECRPMSRQKRWRLTGVLTKPVSKG